MCLFINCWYLCLFLCLAYNTINPINRNNLNYVPEDFNSFCLVTGTLHFIV